MFGAFSIVFQEGRGWSEGVGGKLQLLDLGAAWLMHPHPRPSIPVRFAEMFGLVPLALTLSHLLSVASGWG